MTFTPVNGNCYLMQLASIEQGLEDLRAGKFLIVVDDQDRENEGDLVMPAEYVTAESVNFMVTHARGQLCMPMTAERLAELDIPMLPSRNSDSLICPPRSPCRWTTPSTRPRASPPVTGPQPSRR